jgi:hypothetical protein
VKYLAEVTTLPLGYIRGTLLLNKHTDSTLFAYEVDKFASMNIMFIHFIPLKQITIIIYETLKTEQEAKYMELTWRAKMIGPTLPSFYLGDDRLPSNKSYGFDLFSGDAPCMYWLEKQNISSVVLASYGTFSTYDTTQLEEIGTGLCNSGKPFIWVVRSTEAHKLTEELKMKCEKTGLIVSWCPQLEVLAHKATGTMSQIYFFSFSCGQSNNENL